MENVLSNKKFPVNANDYKIYEEIGEGVSATVHRALCIPLNRIVAIKILDLEKCNNDLDGTRREVQTMSLIDHPNVLRAYCSFSTGQTLWVVMPYMAGGSCLHIMKFAFPEGFEEPVIATLLREVLKALAYLHSHGNIHRDVKAGNILIDSNGAVKLADFGVSVCMFDAGDRQRSRNTFVGTPCWMAPEVMQQLHGYDFKADIWSFGITALELAHGHAPFSKYPPMKVLLMTLQNAPPGLDYERDKRFSKSFKEMVAACLVKEPKKRPTPEKLLKHHFFKSARTFDYLPRTILHGLLPLGDRFRILKAKEADILVQNNALYSNKEELSQREYIRGISAWNFNLEDLKHKATLIQDADATSNSQDSNFCRMAKNWHDDILPAKEVSPESDDLSNVEYSHGFSEPCEGIGDLPNLESSLASFPIQPLQALKGYFDVSEDDVSVCSSNRKTASQLDFERQLSHSSTETTNIESEKNDGEHLIRNGNLSRHVTSGKKKFFSSSLIHNNALMKKTASGGDRENLLRNYHIERNYSGPLVYRQNKDIGDLPTAESAVIQRKGRFKVTSEELSPKGAKKWWCKPVCGVVLPSLQCILEQNTVQREEIWKLMKLVDERNGNGEWEGGDVDHLQKHGGGGCRESELLCRVIHLEECIRGMGAEIEQQKSTNSKLERQLKGLLNQEASHVM